MGFFCLISFKSAYSLVFLFFFFKERYNSRYRISAVFSVCLLIIANMCCSKTLQTCFQLLLLFKFSK